MKDNIHLITRLNVFMISVLLIMNTACEFRKPKPENASDLMDLKSKATSLLKKSPDSALFYTDSAIGLAKKQRLNDTIVIAFLQLKAKAFLKKGIFDSARVNLEKARSLAIFSSNTQAQGSIDIRLGSMMLDNGSLRSAEKYLWEAVEILDQGQDQDKKGEAYNLYGSLLADRGDILKSQQYLFKAFACFENRAEFSTISRICNNIASNYKAHGSSKEALSYYRKALDYAIKAKDTVNISSAYNNIGIFYRTSQPDSALIFYKRSLSLLHPGENSLMEIITRYNIANLYFDQKEYETAKADYLHLLEVCRKGKNVGGVARIYISLAAYYSKNDRYPEAKRYLADAIALSDSIGDKRIHNYALNELKDLYIKTKDYKYALDLTLMIKKNGDSTLVAEKGAAVHEIELLYESEKKDAENARLKYEVSSQQTALKYRMVIILLFILSTIGMLFLIRRLTKLNKQRSLAYHQLVNKYKLESELLNRLRSLRTSEIETGANSEIQASNRLLEQLIEYYVVDKPFLDPKLKVADVAEKLNCSQKAISAALKGYTDTNFNAFTNRFRVDAAIAMMDDTSYANYKIEAIARESGFGSKTNFYATFESFTGVKPHYYRSYRASQVAG